MDENLLVYTEWRGLRKQAGQNLNGAVFIVERIIREHPLHCNLSDFVTKIHPQSKIIHARTWHKNNTTCGFSSPCVFQHAVYIPFKMDVRLSLWIGDTVSTVKQCIGTMQYCRWLSSSLCTTGQM